MLPPNQPPQGSPPPPAGGPAPPSPQGPPGAAGGPPGGGPNPLAGISTAPNPMVQKILIARMAQMGPQEGQVFSQMINAQTAPFLMKLLPELAPIIQQSPAMRQSRGQQPIIRSAGPPGSAPGVVPPGGGQQAAPQGGGGNPLSNPQDPNVSKGLTGG